VVSRYLLFVLSSLFQRVQGNARLAPTGLPKDPAALRHMMIIQQFDRQGPAINMHGGAKAKSKNVLARLAA
jgi:hypothetical protein